ncbi:hypothetical protein GH733_006179, partial [Mirounga leonina]
MGLPRTESQTKTPGSLTILWPQVYHPATSQQYGKDLVFFTGDTGKNWEFCKQCNCSIIFLGDGASMLNSGYNAKIQMPHPVDKLPSGSASPDWVWDQVNHGQETKAESSHSLQWIQMKTGNKIRCSSERRHWRRMKPGPYIEGSTDTFCPQKNDEDEDEDDDEDDDEVN